MAVKRAAMPPPMETPLKKSIKTKAIDRSERVAPKKVLQTPLKKQVRAVANEEHESTMKSIYAPGLHFFYRVQMGCAEA